MPAILARMALLLGLLAGGAEAQVLPQSAAEPPRISLLTFAPGPLYWQRFGHNALLVEDRAAQRTAVYNYGMFDFAQQNFFINFARGRMNYRLDVVPLRDTLWQYAAEARWIYAQELALEPEQARTLAGFLRANARPENAEYRYDYLRDNCSTRLRDAIDQALGGGLRQQLEPQATGSTYRFEATRLIAPLPGLMSAMDLALAAVADQPINRWQQSFVPEVLMAAVREAKNGQRPLVRSEGWLLPDSRSPAVPAAPLDVLPYTLPAGLLLGGLLPLLAGRRQSRWARYSLAGLMSFISLACGLGGLSLLLLWTLTDHWPIWANHNLLLASPLSLLLVPAAQASARAGWQPAAWLRTLAWLLVAGAVAAALWQWLPGAQRQWPWIALLLPVHLGLALALHRRR